MSVFDIASKILLNVQADTSQARAELKNLEGAEREAAKASIAAAEERNTSLDGYIDKIGKVGLALNTFQTVISGAMEGLTAYSDNLRLEAATSKVSVDALIDSFDGLISKHDALVFAAKALHAAIPLTQEQMNQLGKDAVALSHQGLGSVQEISDKLLDSVVSLRTRGLKELGISVKETGTESSSLSEILEGVHQKAQSGAVTIGEQADAAERARVSLKNFGEEWDIFKGELVLAAPSVEDMTAQLKEMAAARDLYTDHTSSAPVDFEKAVGNGFSYDDVLGDNTAPNKDPWEAEANVTSAGITRGIVALDHLAKKFGDFGEAQKKAKEAALEAAKKRAEEKKAEDELFLHQGYAGLIGNLNGGEAIGSETANAQSADIHNLGLTKLAGIGIAGQDQGALDSIDAAMDKIVAKQKGETLMEQLFGKTEELSVYQNGLKAISEVMTGMASSAAAGLDAMILGSESGAKSFSKSIGSILHSLAVKELTQGMLETGEGLAALFVDPAAAPGHFEAAAIYTGIGAAADLAARGLGYSSGSSSSSSSSSASSGGGAGAGGTTLTTSLDQGTGQTTQIFVVGDPGGSLTGSTPRMQQANFQRIQALVSGTTGVAFK